MEPRRFDVRFLSRKAASRDHAKARIASGADVLKLVREYLTDPDSDAEALDEAITKAAELKLDVDADSQPLALICATLRDLDKLLVLMRHGVSVTRPNSGGQSALSVALRHSARFLRAPVLQHAVDAAAHATARHEQLLTILNLVALNVANSESGPLMKTIFAANRSLIYSEPPCS